jgi:hypothetical protein
MEKTHMSSDFTEKVFFYCCPPCPPEQAYQHSLVSLAEGFKSLGIQFYSNINYWQISPDKEEYLFCHDPEVTPDDCSIVIIENAWFLYDRPFPEKLFHPKRKYLTVYFEHATPAKYAWEAEFRKFDFIFRAHYNSRRHYPSNFHPWAFGLSNRILSETQLIPSFQDKKRILLVNFRLSHPVRDIVQENFFPLIEDILTIDSSIDKFDDPPQSAYDYLQWFQTGQRHYPSYYKRLREAAACACFGGLLLHSWPRYPSTPANLWDRILHRLVNPWDSRPRIINWESWRFWESLAAGCATFHVDFEKYDLFLPVMPENWHHYIGIDLNKMQEAAARIADEPEILERVASEGRAWVLKYYSPTPTALRFLETIRKQLSR